MCFDIWVYVFWYTSLFNYDILKNFKEFYKCFFSDLNDTCVFKNEFCSSF